MCRSPAPGLEQVHQITLPTPWEPGSVHVYLIESEPLTLVDAGVRTEASQSALGFALESLGYGFEDLERLVLTHYHQDHLGLAESLRQAADDLEVLAHRDAVAMVEGFSVERDQDIEGTADLLREYGVPEDVIERIGRRRRARIDTEPVVCEATRVDRVLAGGERLACKDFELEVIHSPGHTAGHILLHHTESGVLISGDQILGGAVPNTENYYVEGVADPRDPLRRRPRFRGLFEYRRSLQRLRRQSFTTILPGFGGVIRNADRAISDALLFYEVRIQRIERSLRSLAALGRSASAYELWCALFPSDDPEAGMRTHLLMVIGALDVLESEGRCSTRRRDDGVLVHAHVGG